MLKYLRLRNVGPAPEMELRLGERLNLLTGDNGLGKSFLLDVIWWALTRRWPQDLNAKLTSGYPARPTDPKVKATIEFAIAGKSKEVRYESTYHARDQAWIGKAGRPLNPGLVIYAHADGGFSVWDPARNYWKKKGNIDEQERPPGYVFSPKEVWDGLEVDIGGKPTIVCDGLLRDWASVVKSDPMFELIVHQILKDLSSSDRPEDTLKLGPLTRIGLDGRDIPTLRIGSGAPVPLPYASAGVKRVAALAYVLMWTWSEHGIAAGQLGEDTSASIVLLMDEIESHLHPRWQRSILNSLLKVVARIRPKLQLQLIAATHSPLVLASAEPLFDESTDAWFDLDYVRSETNGRVELRRRDFIRRGDVSNWLTSDAFDLKQARSLEAEKALTRAMELFRKGAATPEDIAGVDELLVGSLGELDPFWMRWTEFRERNGVAS